ncbi:MAG: HAD family hydrolase [Candidatus Diapherotrites archaeon]
MFQKKLLLFDIDNTLTYGVKSHRKAFHTAFEKVYNVKTTVDVIDHSGMTDLQIVKEVLRYNGLSSNLIESKLENCKKIMVSEFLKNVKSEKIVTTPGAKSLLRLLSKRKEFVFGLVTGNLEPIAWAKLKKTGLDKYFSFGAFGSDGFERNELVKIALSRAKSLGLIHKADKVVLFGDTPRDMMAAKSSNIFAIGVQTGGYTKKALKEAGADYVIKSFLEKDKILQVICTY